MFSNNRIIHLTLVALSLTTNGSEAQQCPQGIKPVSGGKNCPCLSVDNDCIITDTRSQFNAVRGLSCSKLDVSSYNAGSYPSVEVRYSWEMCNYNNFDIELKNKKAKFFDWRRGDKAANIANPRIDLAGKILSKGTCRNEERTITLDTTNRFTVATQLEGFVIDANGNNKSSETDYCYAYTDQSVNFKKGLCKMTTNATCKVNGESETCQEYIDRTQASGRCVDFDASFTWKACNKQPYDMAIFRAASNVKIATIKNGDTSNEKIARVKSMLKQDECQRFGPRVKTINTCADEKLFYSINVQGSKANGKFWFECQEFTFKNLAFGTLAPTTSPTVSVQPSHKPTPAPSISVQPSHKPSPAPSISVQPSHKPTRGSSCANGGKGGNCPPSKGKGGKGNSNSRRNRRVARRNIQKK